MSHPQVDLFEVEEPAFDPTACNEPIGGGLENGIWTPSQGLCQDKAKTYLILPSGQRDYWPMCKAHAQEHVEHVRERLGEIWTIEETGKGAE